MEIYTEEFKALLNQCHFFKLKPPKGGQYNDGFELNAVLKARDQQQFLDFSEKLKINYARQAEEPQPVNSEDFDKLADYIAATTDYAQLKLPEATAKPWLVYKNQNHCLDMGFYITLTTDPFEIHLNANNSSWYEVTVDDLKQALVFEHKLHENGLS